MGNASHAFGFKDPDGKTAEPCDVFRAVAGAYPAAVFIEIPVQDVMAAVFNDPVATVCGKHTLSGGLLRCSTGYTVSELTGVVTGFLLRELSLHEKCLSDMGKIQIVIEFGGGPDFSDFDPAVIRGITSNEIRLPAILEIQFDIFKDAGLIAFDGEVVMSLALPAYIIGELSLGEQGICGDVFVFDIDGIQQRDSHPNFIGALEFLTAFYGQGADFFWV